MSKKKTNVKTTTSTNKKDAEDIALKLFGEETSDNEAAPAVEEKVASVAADEPVAVQEEKKPTKKSEPKAAKKSEPKKPTVEDLTAALWKKLAKANISKIKCLRAVQIEVKNSNGDFEGSFFIAIRPDDKENEREITFANYNDRTGTLFTTLDEGLKFASTSDYDFVSALSEGKISYIGDAAGALELLSILK